MKIPFGINFKPKGGKHKDYTYAEVSCFIENAENIAPQSLQDEYISFIGEWLTGNIKPSTPIDIDVLKLFQEDLDNRCQIDFREEHDHEDDIIAGGEYFGRVAKKLEAHIHRG